MTKTTTGAAAPPLGDSRWIRRSHPRPDCAVRLLCLPHAGGSSSFFHPVSAAMPPWVEVLAVQYPGRQDRRTEPHIADLSVLADHVFAEVRADIDRPLALFGHSMGALIGYEVALRIQDAGLPAPVRLFASGRRAPSVYRDEKVHAADDATVIRELGILSGPEAPFLTDPDVLAMSLPSIRADYEAVENYRHTPGRRLDCPITVLTGDADPRVSEQEARAWSGHTSAATDVRVFAGGHFFLVDHGPEINALIAGLLPGPSGAGAAADRG